MRAGLGERHGNNIPGRIFLQIDENRDPKIAGPLEAKASR